MDGSSPILPAGRASSPILILALKNVPVVRTMQFDSYFFPSAELFNEYET